MGKGNCRRSLGGEAFILLENAAENLLRLGIGRGILVSYVISE